MAGHAICKRPSSLSVLPAKRAYLDGKLCGVRSDGKISFSLIQAVSDSGNAAALVFFLFDPLYVDGEMITVEPLLERKERLQAFCRMAARHCNTPTTSSEMALSSVREPASCRWEGITSKRADAPYSPNNRGLWLKVKCRNREEFVVVGWNDPEGARPWLGAR